MITALQLESFTENSTLNLRGRCISDLDIPLICDYLREHRITDLDVAQNTIGPLGARALAACSSLIMLDITYNHIGAEGAKALANSPSLTTLYTTHNDDIGPEAAIALAANTLLTTLSVGDNQIGTEGAIALANSSSLRTLHAYDNFNIAPAGTMALATSQSLINLNLGRNPIDPASAIALAANTSLTMLDLRDTPLSEEALAALREENPLTRANLVVRIAGQVKVPSLRRLSLFACREAAGVMPEVGDRGLPMFRNDV